MRGAANFADLSDEVLAHVLDACWPAATRRRSSPSSAARIEQYQRLGASCDYERERFTLDDDYAWPSTFFVALYEKGYIYRDNYMVNWDPGSQSAISDLEVVNREDEDTLFSIDYPVEGSDRVLTVATVRPETMLADTAVAVTRTTNATGPDRQVCVLPFVGRCCRSSPTTRRPGVRHRRTEDHPRA